MEALTTPPDPRNPAFVSRVYLDLLHRQADAGGFIRLSGLRLRIKALVERNKP